MRLNCVIFAAAFLAVPCAGSGGISKFSVESIALSGKQFDNQSLLSDNYGFGCAGANASPDLKWSGAPKGTKSFVVNIHDPDAETGVGWMHWVVINIPASQPYLPASIKPDGTGLPAGAMQTRTDFGVPGYAGPCPPEGKPHRYRITITALSVDKLPEAVGPDATPALVGFFVNRHNLGQAMLEITQSR